MLPTVEQMPDAFVCVPCRVWQCAGVSVGRWQCAHLRVVPTGVVYGQLPVPR